MHLKILIVSIVVPDLLEIMNIVSSKLILFKLEAIKKGSKLSKNIRFFWP